MEIMNKIFEFNEAIPTGVFYGAAAVVAPITFYAAVKWYLAAKRRKEWLNFPKDTVILHQLRRGPYAPSISPFPVKLETYLRINNLHYQNDHSGRMSSKFKIPWITFNGTDIPDSQLCVEFLNKQFGIAMNKDLSSEQFAIGHAVAMMLEEHLYWYLVAERYKNYPEKVRWVVETFGAPFPGLLLLLVKRHANKLLWSQGMGRFSKDEMEKIAYKSFKSFSTLLGNKKYFFGDSLCEFDCTFFGFMCQFVWQCPGTYGESLVNGEFSNIREYCTRIKNEFWPDWNECITKES